MKIQDKIVESVVYKYHLRSKVGIKKYGTTLEDSKENLIDFIQHAQEEAMDFCLYLEKMLQILKDETNSARR